MFLLFLSVTLALTVSATCSLLEATLLSLMPSQVAALAQRRRRIGRTWQHFKRNIDKPIAAILIVNTAAHTIGATIAGAQFEMRFGNEWILAFSLLFTYLMLQFTEILPKTLGVAYNAALAPLIAAPLAGLVRAMSPVIWFVRLVNRPFERERERPDGAALREIAALASAARIANVIDPRQERLILAASRLPELRVRQIMTPRLRVTHLRLDEPMEEILAAIQASPHTRLPLCRDTLDHVVGMIHVKDLLKHLKLMVGRLRFIPDRGPGGEPIAVVDAKLDAERHVIGTGQVDLLRIKREISFVPEMMSVADLLRHFQESRRHMVVVVDEYGLTQGIVTLEDVLEEMVGSIEDEFDQPAPPPFEKTPAGYRVSGLYPLHDLLAALPLEGVAQEEEVTTIGGYVTKRLGRLPEVGDTVRIGPYEARVLSLSRRQIGQILLVPAPEAKRRGSRPSPGEEPA